MKIRRAKLNCAAFTLVEMIISAALMALVLGGAYACLRSGTASQKMIQAREEILQNARVAIGLISADLRSACPISKEYDFVGMSRALGDAEADNLDFATRNYTPVRLREADFCETSYFMGRDTNSGGFVLWRRRDPTPDEKPFDGGEREEIARGLAGLKFEYYDGFDWYDEWGDPNNKRKGQATAMDPPNLSGFPDAVRITMWFAEKAPANSEERRQESSTNAAPALKFQTVARLNITASAAPGGGGGGGGSGNTGQQGGPAGQGGFQ